GRRAYRHAEAALVRRPHRHVADEDALLEEARVHVGRLALAQAEEEEVRDRWMNIHCVRTCERARDALALAVAELDATLDGGLVLRDLHGDGLRERADVERELDRLEDVGDQRMRDEDADPEPG